MKNKQVCDVRFVATTGVIAGLYTALTLVLAPFSFGLVQCRMSEALTVLAAYHPAAVAGLTVGCALSNMVGLAMGANAAGALDILVGTLATGLAAVLSYRLRSIRWGGLPVLFLTDNGQDVLCREGFVIQAHFLDDVLHDPLGIGGVVDGKMTGIAQPFRIPAQDPTAGGMEGHGPYILPLGAQHGRQTLLQFPCRLVGKGDSQDAPGHHRLHSAEPIGMVPLLLRKRFGKVL